MQHTPVTPHQAEKIRAKYTPSWQLVKGSVLQKRFVADDHKSALAFIQACMLPSERLDHFPDIAFFYNEILIRIYHHDSAGLVDTSFRLAMMIDKIAKKQQLRYDLVESMMDVALQAREPVSPGSRGLMHSRADFGRKVQNPKNVIRGAVAALAAAIDVPTDVDQRIIEISDHFKISEDELSRHFNKILGSRPHDYHRQAMATRKKSPMKI